MVVAVGVDQNVPFDDFFHSIIVISLTAWKHDFFLKTFFGLIATNIIDNYCSKRNRTVDTNIKHLF